MKVRDRLWLFASRAHDDDNGLGRGNKKGDKFTTFSRITPAEGAFMLDVPNLMMVGSAKDRAPVPFSADAYGYVESFRRLDRVLWNVYGSGGVRIGTEEAFILELAEKYPNIRGAFADDIVCDMPFELIGNKEAIAEKTKAQKKIQTTIEGIAKTLATASRPMEFWVTMYLDQIEQRVENLGVSFWDSFTHLSLWTWQQENLSKLSEKLDFVKRTFPGRKLALGIYLFDYTKGESIPLDLMELQCEFALEKLRAGEIEEIVFLTNCVMGVGLPSEYWLREWIAKVKNIEL